MLKMEEIRELIRLVDQSTIEKFEFESGGSKVKIKKGSSGSVAQPVFIEQEVATQAPKVQEVKQVPAENVVSVPVLEVATEDANLHKITSPMVGTFYQSPSPEDAAYVKVGDKVSAESIVCIVEAMKLFNEIEADIDGEIIEILVKDGQLVEYGQPLFVVKGN